MSDRPGARLTGRLTLLVASMRAGGARVGVGELLAAHRALAAIDPTDRDTAYFALRASLCSRRDDIPPFDAAFAEWFSAPPPMSRRRRRSSPRWQRWSSRATRVPGAEAQRPRSPEQVEVVPAAWSDAELLQEKDFAEYTDAERRAARVVMRRLAGTAPTRPSRRTRPARRRGAPPHAARPDLRRTIRSSLRTAGDPFERHWRQRAERPRPLVLVCDVSGSMEPYARMLLQYMQACVAARRRVEAFVFGTRLTRVTAELSGRDPDRALDRAATAASDWSGGTRIGEALATLNREHGRRLGRGAIVVLLSDGWDRGDPEQLSARWPGSGAARTPWSGSTRSRPTQPTSRSRWACRRRCPTSITSWRATRLPRWRIWRS